MSEQAPEEKPAAAANQEKASQEEADDRPHPFNWVALVIIAALIVGGWFVITSLSDDTKMQDCIQSGRRNCAPIDTTGR
jgi:hypothetical protein